MAPNTAVLQTARTRPRIASGTRSCIAAIDELKDQSQKAPAKHIQRLASTSELVALNRKMDRPPSMMDSGMR
jgi:hypothetical protein